MHKRRKQNKNRRERESEDLINELRAYFIASGINSEDLFNSPTISWRDLAPLLDIKYHATTLFDDEIDEPQENEYSEKIMNTMKIPTSKQVMNKHGQKIYEVKVSSEEMQMLMSRQK